MITFFPKICFLGHNLSFLVQNVSGDLYSWSKRETQVPFSQLGKLDDLGTMSLVTDPAEAAQLSVWIYEKKNSALLFVREKLVFHFNCNKFRQSLEEREDNATIAREGSL